MKYLLVFVFASSLQTAFCQDSSFYRKPANKAVAYLQPIEMASAIGPYFYDGKRLRTPFSLQVPFIQLNDPAVNKQFEAYRISNTVAQVVSFVPLFFVLSGTRNSQISRSQYFTVLLASVGVTLGAGIFGQIKIRKAVMGYNAALAKSRLSLSVQGVQLANVPAVGASFTHRF